MSGRAHDALRPLARSSLWASLCLEHSADRRVVTADNSDPPSKVRVLDQSAFRMSFLGSMIGPHRVVQVEC
jgi:hypothetical protein